MFKYKKKVTTLIYHDVDFLATPTPNDICCEIIDEDITENCFYIPENKYYMKNYPGQEGPIEWNTRNGRFWMRGKISKSSKILITLRKAEYSS